MTNDSRRRKRSREIMALRRRVAELKTLCAHCRAAEEAARHSEERYRRLLESVTDYIYTVTVRDGEAVATSHGPGCLAVTGYSAEEYRQNPLLWLSMVPEDDRPAVLAQSQSVLSGADASPLEHRIVHKDGSVRFVRNTPVVRRNADGAVVSYDGIINDITENKVAEAEITRLFLHDGLTGLPNRILFMERLRQALAMAERRGETVAVYFIDLDFFKDVNDAYGHEVGDTVLAAVAERLLRCVRRSDTVARIGGDEFLGLTPAIGEANNACAIAEKMVCAMREPFPVAEQVCRLGASVGVALFPDQAKSGEDLLRLADQAMYAAKRAGRNGWRLAGIGEGKTQGREERP